MIKLEASIQAPLTQWDDGSIRITGSRVPIDTIIHHFKLGATAEEINYKFPSLQLSDLYGVIYYYLLNRQLLDQYLSDQETEADGVQQRLESDSEYQQWRADMVNRLLARNAEKNRLVTPPAAD
jgi:uncharacterized protein (DUF433 family)